MKRICNFSTYQFLVLGLLFSLLNSCNSEVDPKLLPVLTTNEISKVTEATAQSGGKITSDAGSDITARGICWGTSPNPTIDDNKTLDAAGTGVFNSKMTGLIPSTIYYVRAYATNKKGTAYGIQLTFSTKSLSLITTEITSITINSAKSGGTIATDGDSINVSVRGICWGTQSSPTILNNKTTDGNGIGKFTSNMTDLILGTTYYIRAYVTNSGGTIYGNELTFITNNGVMTLTTTSATSITATSATVGGSVPIDGGATVTERGICISKLPTPTITNKIANGTGTGSFATNITGLEANTTYYARVYATNSVNTYYGNEINFTTKDGVISLTTNAATSINATSATIGVTITSDGGASITTRGVCWSTIPNPTTANDKSTNTGGTGSFSTNITGLNNGAKYYVKSYATNSLGTSYGNEISLTTQNGVISLTTSTASSITALTASSGGNVTSDGGALVTNRGVCWNTSPNPTLVNNKIQTGTGTGIFTSSVTNLSANTTYYVRAYATNSIGTVYGNEVSFKTQNGIITLSTASISSITSFTSKSGGIITADGGAPVTMRGVCWSTTPNPSITNYKTTDATGIGSFTSSISGLTLGVTYYVKAYATNNVGTFYGNEVAFVTVIAIGDNYLGGKIAYLDNSGKHGFVCSLYDLNIYWTHWSTGYLSTGATSTELETSGVYGITISGGKINTDKILSAQGTGAYAASKCAALIIGNASAGDWYLPSKGELNQIFINRSLLGDFVSAFYWSSSEVDPAYSWGQSFDTGSQSKSLKTNPQYIRAIRAF